jgi:pyruvate/2-oxoacid:ferredoxin oxidoreductase alpha subunit
MQLLRFRCPNRLPIAFSEGLRTLPHGIVPEKPPELDIILVKEAIEAIRICLPTKFFRKAILTRSNKLNLAHRTQLPSVVGHEQATMSSTLEKVTQAASPLQHGFILD